MIQDTINHWAHHRGQMTVYLQPWATEGARRPRRASRPRPSGKMASRVDPVAPGACGGCAGDGDRGRCRGRRQHQGGAGVSPGKSGVGLRDLDHADRLAARLDSASTGARHAPGIAGRAGRSGPAAGRVLSDALAPRRGPRPVARTNEPWVAVFAAVHVTQAHDWRRRQLAPNLAPLRTRARHHGTPQALLRLLARDRVALRGRPLGPSAVQIGAGHQPCKVGAGLQPCKVGQGFSPANRCALAGLKACPT